MFSDSRRQQTVMHFLLARCSIVQWILSLLFCTTYARILQHQTTGSNVPLPSSEIISLQYQPQSSTLFPEKELIIITEASKNSEEKKEDEQQQRRSLSSPPEQKLTRIFKHGTIIDHAHDHLKPSVNEDYTFHVDYAGPKRHPPHSH